MFDSAKYNKTRKKKIISYRLKASTEQITENLNGTITLLQRRMMWELLVHLDELNTYIKRLNDKIDNFMKPEKTGLKGNPDRYQD